MSWKDELKDAWITEKVTPEAVEFAERFGKTLAPKSKYDNEALTTTQLRKFFGEVKRQLLQQFNETSLAMLKPKLAYAVGRAKPKASRNAQLKIVDFYEVVGKAVDIVLSATDKEKARKNFATLLEAIVAYHKANAIE